VDAELGAKLKIEMSQSEWEGLEEHAKGCAGFGSGVEPEFESTLSEVKAPPEHNVVQLQGVPGGAATA